MAMWIVHQVCNGLAPIMHMTTYLGLPALMKMGWSNIVHNPFRRKVFSLVDYFSELYMS